MAESFYKPYVDVLSNLFYPQRCVGCERRANDVLCRGCFEALPFVRHPFCGRCGAPTAFEVYGRGECSTRYFGFEDARAPLRYEGVGARAYPQVRRVPPDRGEGDGATLG